MFRSIPIDSRYKLTLVLLILFALALRLRSLDLHSLWFDEAIEYWVATAPLDQIFTAVRDAIQDPPLYSLILHFWIMLGRTEFILRLPSVFISLLSISAAYALGRHAHSRRAGLIAALFFAVLPANLRYAQEVGQYAILLFGLLLSLLAFSYARETNQWKYWILWLIAALLSVYNYYGSLLVILPVSAALFVEHVYKNKRPYLARQAITFLPFIMLILPLLLFWLPQQLFRGPTIDAFRMNLLAPSAEFLAFVSKSLQLLTYQIAGHAAWPTYQSGIWALMLLVFLLILLSLKKTTRHAYLIIWFFLSWLAYFAAGRLGVYPYGGSRHALILTPLLIPLIAIGVASLWRSRPLFGLLMMTGFLLLILSAPQDGREDLRTVLNQYLAKRGDNLPTYVDYGAVPAFRYQLQLQRDMSEDIPAVWYISCWDGTAESYCEQDNILYGRDMTGMPPKDKVAAIISAVDASKTVFWLIVSHAVGTENEELLNSFRNLYAVEDAIVAEGASAYKLRRR